MRPRLINLPDPLVSGELDSSTGRIVFWSLAETAGATAHIRWWDGSGPGTTLLATFTFHANDSFREFPGFYSLPYRVGLFLEVVSGTVEGSLSIVPWRESDEGQWGIPVVVVGGIELNVFESGG